MNCQTIQELLPLYMDDVLSSKEQLTIKEHLANCPVCQGELKSFEESWDFLTQWKDVAPNPNFVSRFWTRAAVQPSPWYQNIGRYVRTGLRDIRLPSAAALVCLMVMVSWLSVNHFSRIQEAERTLSTLNEENLEMVNTIELTENYDVIQDIDFLQDMDLIERMDTSS